MNFRTRVPPFRVNAAMALRDASLRSAMSHAAEVFAGKRSEAFFSVPFEEWRQEASELRLLVLKDLPHYVDDFAVHATKAGQSSTARRMRPPPAPWSAISSRIGGFKR
jgi:L-lactate utilization protein LutB